MMKARQKSATPLQLMQLVGPKGLMRRVDLQALKRAAEQRKNPASSTARPTPAK